MRNRRYCSMSLARLSVAAMMTAISVSAQQLDIPRHMVAPWSNDSTTPCWVNGASVVSPSSKSISSQYLGLEFQEKLTSLVAQAASSGGGCIDYGEVYDEIPNPPQRGSLVSAFETSQFSFRARVSAAEGGFFGSVPGTLLRLEPLEIFRRNPEVFQAESYLVFIPVGRIEIGGATICKRDHRFAEQPSVGDEVLVFVPNWARAAAGELLDLIDENGLITLRQDGSVSLPAGYRSSLRSEGGLTQLLSTLREMAQARKSP